MHLHALTGSEVVVPKVGFFFNGGELGERDAHIPCKSEPDQVSGVSTCL